MTNPSTEPGLGGPAPAPTGSDTMPDASPSPPKASFDDAMHEAELRVAETHNREIVEREAERRRVHLDTMAKLREVERGSEAHFALLALRQEWTLPLDDDDYVLWMQRHLLAQHGQAMADEASQKRRAKAKAMARGPAMVIAVVAGLATVAAIGWWLRGSGEQRAPATAESAAPTAPAETATPTAKPTEAATAPPLPPSAAESAASAAPVASASAAATADASAPAASTPVAAPTVSVRPGGAPRGGPGKPPAPKPDLWEREF